MVILNVEDNKAASGALAKLIAKVSEGRVQVLSAYTLEDGLRMSKESQPDVTFLDLTLPDSPDWQNTVANISKFKPPVIVITALDITCNDFEIKFACMRAGAQRVFEKPFMNKAWSWFWESTNEMFISRLLGTAEAAHLRNVLGPQNGTH